MKYLKIFLLSIAAAVFCLDAFAMEAPPVFKAIKNAHQLADYMFMSSQMIQTAGLTDKDLKGIPVDETEQFEYLELMNLSTDAYNAEVKPVVDQLVDTYKMELVGSVGEGLSSKDIYFQYGSDRKHIMSILIIQRNRPGLKVMYIIGNYDSDIIKIIK